MFYTAVKLMLLLTYITFAPRTCTSQIKHWQQSRRAMKSNKLSMPRLINFICCDSERTKPPPRLLPLLPCFFVENASTCIFQNLFQRSLDLELRRNMKIIAVYLKSMTEKSGWSLFSFHIGSHFQLFYCSLYLESQGKVLSLWTVADWFTWPVFVHVHVCQSLLSLLSLDRV